MPSLFSFQPQLPRLQSPRVQRGQAGAKRNGISPVARLFWSKCILIVCWNWRASLLPRDVWSCAVWSFRVRSAPLHRSGGEGVLPGDVLGNGALQNCVSVGDSGKAMVTFTFFQPPPL